MGVTKDMTGVDEGGWGGKAHDEVDEDEWG